MLSVTPGLTDVVHEELAVWANVGKASIWVKLCQWLYVGSSCKQAAGQFIFKLSLTRKYILMWFSSWIPTEVVLLKLGQFLVFMLSNQKLCLLPSKYTRIKISGKCDCLRGLKLPGDSNFKSPIQREGRMERDNFCKLHINVKSILFETIISNQPIQ